MEHWLRMAMNVVLLAMLVYAFYMMHDAYVMFRKANREDDEFRRRLAARMEAEREPWMDRIDEED